MPEPTQTSEKEQNSVNKFLSEASLLSKEYAKGLITNTDPRFLAVVDSLGNVGAEVAVGMLDMEELVKGYYPTDRHTKGLLRNAFDAVEARAADEKYEDPEMAHLIASGTRRVIPLFGVNVNKPREEIIKVRVEEDFNPNVSEASIAQLKKVNKDIEAKKYPTREIVKALGDSFLGIYYPASTELKRAAGQQKADLIGESHAYAHTLGKLLVLTPDNARTKAWQDVKSSIIDTTALKTGNVYPTERQDEQPEVREFLMMMKGIRLEVTSFEELKKMNGKEIHALRFAETEEDIKEQFDIAFSDSEGTEFYLDTKSGRPYEDMVNRNQAVQIEDGVAIKKSKGADKLVIVVNIDKRGYNGQDTRKFELSDPLSFRNAITAGIAGVRERHQQ